MFRILLQTNLISLALFAATVGDGAEVDYLQEIKPILESRCYACHGALKHESGLRLDTAKMLLEGGDSGPVVLRAQSSESRLIEAVTGDIQVWRMPPEGEPLTERQIDLLRRWIDQGAPAPNNEQPQLDPSAHWAFQPPTATHWSGRPGIAQRNEVWTTRNVIDAFVATKHQQLGLMPAPPADRQILLRRVYLDLIGLPPTPQQRDNFLADEAPGGYERVVDRLLASPHYGERWGRHWMDVWRYADWSGEVNNQVRGSPRHIWRWRDWIVDSLNEDKGYDQMIGEMLAADEVAPDDPDALRATGFLARNWYKFNRNVWLDDVVEHTAKAFLGLTYSCAKCHDHKYDPITQQNYYELRAFFEPHDVRTDPVSDEADLEKDGLVRVFDAQPDAPTFLFYRGDERQPDREHPLSPGLPEVLGRRLDIEPLALPAQEGAARSSTGRRLALVQWLVDRRNPLTARVAVNHIWLRHFGAPLVEDVTDFGLRSPLPRYAELLDQLAIELMDNDWSMKTVHRLIVTSHAYRMSSGAFEPAPVNLEQDPDNLWLWRMNHRRLEAEVIRDSMLPLADNLDLTLGGREIPLDEDEVSRRRSIYFRHGHERQVKFLELFNGASVLECYRRPTSIVPQQALALSNSVVARTQSRLVARQLSADCKSGADSDETFVRLAFERVLARPPNTAEIKQCSEFLTRQTSVVTDQTSLTYFANGPEVPTRAAIQPRERARESLVHVLLNHNDFVTVR